MCDPTPRSPTVESLKNSTVKQAKGGSAPLRFRVEMVSSSFTAPSFARYLY